MNLKGSSLLLSGCLLCIKKGPSFPLRSPMRSFALVWTPPTTHTGSVCAHGVTELFELLSVLSLRVTSLLLLFFGIPGQ